MRPLLSRLAPAPECGEEWAEMVRGWLDAGDHAGYGPLAERLLRPRLLDHATAALVDQAALAWARPGFDELVSLPRLRFEPYEHQLDAARRALRGMRGRAILADEVGLGKTIEAGLCLSELRMRGLADRVLVLTPAGLVEQWHQELDRKFGLPTTADPTPRDEIRLGSGDARDVVVLSLAAARRSPLRDRLAEASWDLVVVDEAHRLKQPRSASAKLVRSLLTRYLLLLTATPVENRLDDLFQLVSLVRPGHLGTLAEFRREHGARPDAAPRAVEQLHARMAEVLIRHRRSQVAIMLPRRLASTVRATPEESEAALYRAVSERVRDQAREASHTELLGLRSVQRLAGSSPRALAAGLERRGWDDLAAQARGVGGGAKGAVLRRILDRHLAAGEKVVVFTAFRETLGLLAEELGPLHPVAYHGSLARREKEAVITRFREESPILLTTESAGEGRNLQFAHVMVNYDLPWNPMQIEQRLGRIHRIGQRHDVTVANLAARGTIEDHLLEVLERKIDLFELVIGELDMILGRVEEEFDFEQAVFQLHLESRDEGEFTQRLERLGDEIAQARRGYLESRERNDAVVGDGPPT